MRKYIRAGGLVCRSAFSAFDTASVLVGVVTFIVFLGLFAFAWFGWLGTWAKANKWAVAMGLLALLFFWVAVKLQVKLSERTEPSPPTRTVATRDAGTRSRSIANTSSGYDVGLIVDPAATDHLSIGDSHRLDADRVLVGHVLPRSQLSREQLSERCVALSAALLELIAPFKVSMFQASWDDGIDAVASIGHLQNAYLAVHAVEAQLLAEELAANGLLTGTIESGLSGTNSNVIEGMAVALGVIGQRLAVTQSTADNPALPKNTVS